MRWVFVTALVLVAGCVAAPSASVPVMDDTAPATPVAPAEPAPPMGVRAAASMERFVFLENHTLGFTPSGTEVMPEIEIPNDVAGTAFYQSLAIPFALTPWSTPPFLRAFETTGDIEITVSLRASSAAVNTLPRQADFPAVGGWFGTPDRFMSFIGASDAPDTLEADKTYTVHLVVANPSGGIFIRENEPVALFLFAGYQTADDTPISWVVGGLDPAGFVLPHQHFNLSAPNATLVFDGPGEIGPNPSPLGAHNPQPVDIPFKVPSDAVYVTVEIEGQPKGGDRIDVDVDVRKASGEIIASGSSPTNRELVVLGPGNLASAGRDLVAHITAGSAPAGGTFTLRITAYGR